MKKKNFYSQTLKNTNLKNVTIQLKLNSREKKNHTDKVNGLINSFKTTKLLMLKQIASKSRKQV